MTYLTDEPCLISFSGGRTSAYMLYRVLDEAGGELPENMRCVFANTGKEMDETLDFVEAVSRWWGVKITWVEARVEAGSGKNKWDYSTVVVDHSTASRRGEPFEQLIMARQYLPNPVARFCTQELKVRRMNDWMRREFSEWRSMLGIRRDEPRRFASLNKRENNWMPLYMDGIKKEHVAEFWRCQPFNLELPNNNGVTDWGNCDLCFLKGLHKKRSILAVRPELGEWWATMEEKVGGYFRKDQPPYREMLRQGNLLGSDLDGGLDCFCGE